MRTTPRVGTKLWFGPRRLGWGWDAISVEGWIVAGVAVVAIVVPALMVSEDDAGSPVFFLWTFAVIAALLFTCYLKGTSPGGPKRYREFERHRSGAAG